MGRRSKPNRVNQHQCHVCSALFDAVRHDARYCSSKCRKKISRAMALVRTVSPPASSPAGKKWSCQRCSRVVSDRKQYCVYCEAWFQGRKEMQEQLRAEREQDRDGG